MSEMNSTPTHPKQSMRWLVLLMGLGVLSILVIEVGGRHYLRAKLDAVGKQYGIWESDPVLGAIVAANRFNSNWQTNDYAFRSDENLYQPKTPGHPRIIVYGGSTALCYNLSTEDSWPTLLQSYIRKRLSLSRSQVLNAADIVWSISHLAIRAKREIPILQPDFILFYSGINEEYCSKLLKSGDGLDLENLVAEKKFGVPAKSLSQSYWLERHSLTWKIFKFKVLVPLLEALQAVLVYFDPEGAASTGRAGTTDKFARQTIPYVFENYLEVLKDFVSFLKAHQVKPIFIIQAYSRDIYPQPPSLTQYSREAAAILASQGVLVIDSQKAIDAYEGDSTELFLPSGVHFTKKGAEVLAEYLFEELKPHIVSQVVLPSSN